MVDSENPKNGC